MVKVTDIQMILLSQYSLYSPEVLGHAHMASTSCLVPEKDIHEVKKRLNNLNYPSGNEGFKQPIKRHWGGQLTEICVVDQEMN